MRFPFLPLAEGYSVTEGTSPVLETGLEGGAAARRREFTDTFFRFTCSFSLAPRQYDEFSEFYQAWLRDKNPDGTLKFFDILLVWQPTNPEYALHNFKCVFSPDDPIQTSEPDGLGILVNCVFEGYLDQEWIMRRAVSDDAC